MEELLQLTRENNEMLKRLCAYIDKIESPQYKENEDMKNMLINLVADSIIEFAGNRRTLNNQFSRI